MRICGYLLFAAFSFLSNASQASENSNSNTHLITTENVNNRSNDSTDVEDPKSFTGDARTDNLHTSQCENETGPIVESAGNDSALPNHDEDDYRQTSTSANAKFDDTEDDFDDASTNFTAAESDVQNSTSNTPVPKDVVADPKRKSRKSSSNKRQKGKCSIL